MGLINRSVKWVLKRAFKFTNRISYQSTYVLKRRSRDAKVSELIYFGFKNGRVKRVTDEKIQRKNVVIENYLWVKTCSREMMVFILNRRGH